MSGIERRGGGAARLPLVLCYHKIEPRCELGVTRVAPARFARQVERLARDGWRALTLAELLACARGERRAGERELAITFDDAYRGLRRHAFPVLAAHAYPATCFVISDYAGRLNRWDVAYGGRRFAHLSWRDARAWQAKGIDFASHTATHPRLTWLDDAAAMRELTRSREALARALDVAPPAVSYPFGAAGARERRLAREAGYDAGFGLSSWWRGDVMDLARLPVYVWSPARPGRGWLAPAERLAAAAANHCAVGTTLWQWLSE